jgi:transcriptional antiterminator NusG
MESIEKKWYVVHTLSGQEYKTKEMLENSVKTQNMQEVIPQVLIPTENVSEVKAGKKSISTRKFFPGYILVNMAFSEETWLLVKQVPGVIGFVGSGTPVPLREDEIKEILEQIEAKKEKVKPKVIFEKGEVVKVTDGPFLNFNGTIDEVYPEKGKLKVLVQIFGRTTPVELEYWQVERE